MDTARFKYPPYWIKVSLLPDAMNALDKSTGLPRRYIILKKKQNSGPLILFSISKNLSSSLHYSTQPEILTFLGKWSSHLQELTTEDDEREVLGKAVAKLLSLAMELKSNQMLLETQKVDACCPCEETKQYRSAIHDLLQQMEKIKLFTIVEEQLKIQEVQKSDEPTNPSFKEDPGSNHVGP